MGLASSEIDIVVWMETAKQIIMMDIVSDIQKKVQFDFMIQDWAQIQMGDRGPLQVENDKKQNYFHKLNKNCIHSFWHFHKICGAIISCCLSTLQVKYLFAVALTV